MYSRVNDLLTETRLVLQEDAGVEKALKAFVKVFAQWKPTPFKLRSGSYVSELKLADVQPVVRLLTQAGWKVVNRGTQVTSQYSYDWDRLHSAKGSELTVSGPHAKGLKDFVWVDVSRWLE